MSRKNAPAVVGIGALVLGTGLIAWAAIPRQLSEAERVALRAALDRVDARIERAEARWARAAPRLHDLGPADAGRCPLSWEPPPAPSSWRPEEWVLIVRDDVEAHSRLAEGLRAARAELDAQAGYTPGGAEMLLARARGLGAAPPPELVLVVSTLSSEGSAMSNDYQLEGTVFLVGDETVCASRVRALAESWQVEHPDAGVGVAAGGTSGPAMTEADFFRLALRWAAREALRVEALGLAPAVPRE